MLQRAVALLLQRLLGKFVSFDSSMLRLSLWQGDLSFQDLELRLSYGEGSIGHLSVKIPWRALWTQAVVIKAHNIRIFLHQTPKSAASVLDGLVFAMDDDSSVGNTSIDAGDGSDIGDDRTYLSRLVAHIIANVQIELSDVQVRYDCTSTSLAERRGSATLEVGFVSLINTDRNWELEFTPQSTANMESRKLLRIERVAAYIEYDSPATVPPSDSAAAPGETSRAYLFHDWYSTVKASLFYHSANASFPDVELDMDVGSSPSTVTESCSVCRACASRLQDLAQPRIHFGAEHIDVLYAILVEVKAPYEEYERLSALTQQQASRPEGFLMVLAYAKQWLLADCLDGVAGETYTLAGDSDDDDDDEFEDAITPPSLSVSAALRQGVSVVFFSRDRASEDPAAGPSRLWTWTLGHTWASVKQSCVEDELQLMVASLKMFERCESGQQYWIIDHAPATEAPDAPFVFFKCIVPAYQSRLVGHQPVMDLQLRQKTAVALKDETLVLWMTLLAPVYLWWTQWNLSHPSKLVVHDEARIAPISNVSVDFAHVQVLLAVHEHFCFGAELVSLRGETALSEDETRVVSHFSSSVFRFFAATQDLATLQRAPTLSPSSTLHDIVVVRNGSLVKASHSRTSWAVDTYTCAHGASTATAGTASSQSEQSAMYTYELALPAVRIDWRVDEIEMVAWVVGKWVFFLPDTSLDRADKNLHLRSGRVPTRSHCNARWSIAVPELSLQVTEARAESQQQGAFELFVRDLEYDLRLCSTSSTQRLTLSSVAVSEGGQTLLHVDGNARLATPAVSLSNSVQRYYADDASHGDAAVLYFVGEVSETNVILERMTVQLYLPVLATALTWMGGCYDRYHLGYVLSTSYGYTMEQFRANLATLQSHASIVRVKTSASYHDETVVNVLLPHGCAISVFHDPLALKMSADERQARAVQVGAIECASLSLQAKVPSGSSQAIPDIKGTVRNLQVRDAATPARLPSETSVMPNRQFIGSNPSGVGGDSVDTGPFGAKNVVDFVVTTGDASDLGYATESLGATALRTVVRVRLDSVCLVYLHRVYKQFHHFVTDHVLAMVADPFDRSPSCAKALSVFTAHAVDVSELPASLDETLRVYADAFASDAAAAQAETLQRVYYEVVANDLTFVLPRSSFSTDSIVLHCTNARFWSAGVDSASSDFLQNGSFGDVSRLSHSSAISDANMAKAQQTRRTELRNVKRLVKNQRSRLLSNRSQLYIDLRNATQQAQNYLHEGFEAFPEAEEAVKIIHHKIVVLDQQLEQLSGYLKEVDDAIDVAKAEGEALSSGGRDSMVFMSTAAGARGRSTSMAQSEAMDRICDAVNSMSQSLMTPLFVADDAEFHDARTTTDVLTATRTSASSPETAAVDMSTSSMGLFEFELVDLSGTTSNASQPLFHHALLTGRIERELESLSEATLSSYLGINLSVNELSVSATPAQYTTLLGAIYENFKEVSSIVDEDTYPLCDACLGHHYADEFCHAIWLRIPIKVADAALRIATDAHPIADIFWEQLELVFVLRTDDSLELNASALSFNVLDVRPTRCATASEILRPLPGDGAQIVYNQKANWTDSVYRLKLHNTNCLLIYPVIQDVVAFFVTPIFADAEFFDYGVGFMGPAPPEWKKMDLFIDSHGCLLSLLEEFGKPDSRALVVLADVALAYSTCQNCDDIVDMRKCHFALDQRGVYFSQLPDLQIDASFPLSNAFQLVVDHFVEGTKALHRRNSFVLAPVETRFSVQDGYLFVNIVNNYLEWISSPPAGAAAPPSAAKSIGDDSESDPTVDKLPPPAPQRSTTTSVVAAAPRVYAVDKLLGDVGEVRLVLVNNSLGIPIADFQMREIVCEYVQDEECSTVVGGILSFNYFNNSIYRWEPLVEPFVVQVRVHRALEENSRVEVFANLPNTVNLNLTPAMAPLLSTEALKQADFVTTGSKSTAPFWIQNNTGMAIKFSFRRGKGNIIQQAVPNDGKVSVDCRERGDMRSFDSTSADRFLRDADRNALTVNHTLSVWLNGNKWVSANPVVVDMVGHVSVPLREAASLHGRAESLDGDGDVEEDLSPPILVAEISIQPDGSKLINLHSQVVLQNRTSVPLMVWAFSPRDGGLVQEWVIDREQLCHVPLQLMHPQSKISIRPSPYVQYAPLATSLEELGDEARVVKSINTKRFIRSGNCVCNFETFATPEELQTAMNCMTRAGNAVDVAPLSGYVVRDLPTWKCTYDVEAYYLMRATFSAIDEPKASGAGGDASDALASVDEEENEKVEDDFRNVFADESARRRMPHHPLSEVNYELDEARTNNQRRGLYEATNSSLFYLSVSPFVTLHNRLATAVAYRLLNGSLQLIAEGILAVGNILPLFQVDATSLLYISFRLENYNWSTPKVVINPKHSAYTVPYKDVIEPVELQGRVFDRDVAWEQGNVPNLQLQVKLTGRDVIVFCSVWIVNHSDLDLEYCNSTSTSAKRLESVLKYVHRQHTSDAEQNAIFSTRNLSFHDAGTRDRAMTRLQKVKAASNPVALIVVIKEAKDLYNAQYFGAQSPYVRASLYVLKNPQDRYLDRPEMHAVCTATTKPSPSGGVNPKWDARLQNTLLLRFPDDVKSLEMARVIVEVRNVRYGMDTCLGVTAVKLESITKDRKSAAAFSWYKLLKRKSSKKLKGKKAAPTSVHRGDVCLSFSVGSSQEVRSELDGSDIVYEIDDEDRTPSVQGDERLSLTSPHESEMNDVTDEDAAMIETQTPGAFPSSAMFRSMHRLQTPASESASFLPASALMMGNGDVITTGAPPGSIRARQAFPLSDLDSTRAQQDMIAFDPLSTRSVSGKGLSTQLNTSPRSVQMQQQQQHQSARPLQIYLPQNRFAFVVVQVHASMALSDIFELVCIKCGFDGVLDINDFDFYELALARFVSLRSAGRPEGDRWYGQRIPMDAKVDKHGRQHGLHLCHKMTMTTIRLYDETSTASTHHMTPRSLLSSSKKTNPAQNRPMAWGDVLPYSAGGKNWDVLRVKSQSSPWSEVIRLNRNAMGNSGVAQVLSLTNEVFDQDQSSDLRRGNQEIALWSCYGTGRFSDTIIATIVPRYILINRTGQTVKYRQVNVPHTLRLGANEVIPFHWPSASRDKLMEVTLLHGFTWSGSFRIHSIGTTYLKLRDSNDLARIYILQCQVEMIGGSIALIFREESKRFPPYRIDNMTSFRIQFKQAGWGTARDFDELQPRASCPYSWDQLTGGEKTLSSSSSSASYQDPTFAGTSTSFARSLQVRFMRVTSSTSVDGDSEKDAVETREYNLDEMTSHRRIQLQRSLPSQLFIKPEHKGYLLKKDNLLKWNKKYFRLYEHMLYYFASESDQELLGVVDLRSGSDVPGAGSVAIFEKTAETQSKGGFMSLNGLVSSISGTIFGSSSRQLAGDDDDDEAHDDDERARDLVQLAVAMTTSTELCAESEAFVERVVANGDGAKLALARKGFYVNGEALIAFLVSDASRLSASQAFATAQEMLVLGVLKVVQAQSSESEPKRRASTSSFRSAKSVWYSVNSINLGDDTDSIESEDDTPQNAVKTPSSAKKPKAKATKAIGTAQFSIITATKCYDLKAKTPRIARAWVKRLRIAARESHYDHASGDDDADEAPTSMINSGPKTARASRDVVPIVQNAKTYVHVRVRADGPTKVLELFEGGEEDFDEKESKHELSSATSAASESPTASETSTNAFDALTNGISIHLRVDSFGISCVNELPMELVYVYFAGVNVHYTRVNAKMRLNVTLDDVQIDNQSQDATFSKLLCPRTHGSASAAAAERKRTLSDAPDDDMAGMLGDRVVQLDGDESAAGSGGLVLNDHMFSCADCKYRQLNVATMHFCCTWSNEQGTTDYFEHCSFWLHPVISQLDEELLVSARAFLTAMMQSLSQNKTQSRGGEIRAKSVPIEIMTESLVEYKENTMSDDLNPLKSLHASTTTSSTEVRKVYFALLHIHPIEFDITYRSDVFQAHIPSLLARDTASFKASHTGASFLREEYSRTASAPASGSGGGGLPRFDYDRQTMSTVSSDDAQKSGVAWAIPSLTMHVPDLDNAPVRLNALMIEHAFGTSGDLTRRVTKYYTRQLWKQLHKILGSFDFLGNPVGFLDHIGTGVRDFVYEPIEGLKVGGKGFSKGLAKGTASLVSNTLDGTFDAASKISGTFGQGLATMSLDDHYQQIRARARRHHVRGIREGLIQGSKELSLGVYEGVAGLVLGPMRGAQENGALGFVKGTITGIIGLPVKPVAGIFDFASRATQGVRNRSLQNGHSMRRVRRPRVFGRYNELKCYKEADTIAYDLLKKTGGAKLSGEKIIFYNEILQSVYASELTKQAREKRRMDSTRERTRSFRRSLNEHSETHLVDGRAVGSERKLVYEVTFYQKKLGLDLETDFYCENVIVKAFDESCWHHTKVHTSLRPDQKVLQEGDCLITVGGVDVRGIGFEETLALLRGTARPIKLQFESCDEQVYEINASSSQQAGDGHAARTRSGSTATVADDDAGARLKVQLTHWLIVTEQRAVYINVSSFANPVVEWMTPLRYIYRIEWIRGSRICLHMSVGVDSLPTGPRSRPTLRALDSHERDMNVFLDVMWHSFGSATAEEQELWPSDTSLNGFLMKKGGFSTVKRWFVLSRNCLYYFSSQKELRGIIPLGNVRLEADASASLSIRITNASRHQPLVTLQLDNGQVIERVQSEIVLLAANRQDFEMWQSSLAHAAGKGLRHSRGTRFFVPTAASRLEVGCRDTPDFVVAPLAEALKKTVEVFNTK